VLEPNAEALVRGDFAHHVLDRVYTRLRELPGAPRRITRENLADAERILFDALRELQADFPISPDRTRVRTAVRRLEFDLLRFLRREAESTSRFEPEQLEQEFGGEGEEPISIGIEGLRLRGRIDRVDTHAGRALVRDYKSGRNVFPVDTWARDNKLQVAIYMLVLRELQPELELAGGVYDPLAGSKPRPRGLLLEESRDDLGDGWVKTDWRDRAGFEQALEEARDAVRDVVARLREGDVKPCPASCAWNGGCSYPSICRHEE
jgi:RecB family exonuclease